MALKSFKDKTTGCISNWVTHTIHSIIIRIGVAEDNSLLDKKLYFSKFLL
jgi:hypothetical protein